MKFTMSEALELTGNIAGKPVNVLLELKFEKFT